MRPKQATISRRMGGPARSVSAAAACALVLAACGGGGDKADSDNSAAGESFVIPSDAASTEAVKASAALSAAALPAYAVQTNNSHGAIDVKVGSHPFAVAVNTKTGKAYAANNYSNDVTVIDGKTYKTTTIKGAGPEPVAVAVNEVTNMIYVANVKGKDKDGNADPNKAGSVTVIDGRTNKVINVTAGHEPSAVVVNDKTNKIYAINQGSNDMTVIDGKTNKTTTVKLRPDKPKDIYDGVLTPQDVRVNRVTNRIYVSGTQSNTIAVIDGKTNKVLENIKVEGLPPAPEAPTANLATSQVGLTPTTLAVDEKRNVIYAADFTSNDVAVIDGKTNKGTIIPLVDVQDPYSIKVNEVTNKIYVANLTSRSITVIDGATKVATTIGDLPGKPHDAAINMKTNKIYFPAYVLYRGAQVGDDKQITGLILELDGETNNITTIVAGVTPYAVAINERANKVFVMNQDSDTVTVLSGPSGRGQAGAAAKAAKTNIVVPKSDAGAPAPNVEAPAP
jgi:YVTN family beta-propeller protein